VLTEFLLQHGYHKVKDVPIDRYSSTRQYHFVTYDLDDDTYVDSFSDIDSNEDDSYLINWK
jgi:hypothetical protein